MMALETQKRSMCNLFARGKQKKTEKGTVESLAIFILSCQEFPIHRGIFAGNAADVD